MSLKLYIGKDCHDCDRVVDYLKKEGRDAEIIDADNDQTRDDIFIRPALFDDDVLKAYGVDIIDYLDHTKEK